MRKGHKVPGQDKRDVQLLDDRVVDVFPVRKAPTYTNPHDDTFVIGRTIVVV